MLRQEKNNHKTNAPSAWNFFLIGWLFFSDFLAGIKCYPEKRLMSCSHKETVVI